MKIFVRHLWKILFIVTGAGAVWIGATFATKALQYCHLSHSVMGKSIHWGISSQSDEKNYIYVDYQYVVGSATYSGRYIYPKAIQSRLAAESILEDKKSEVVQVWYGRPNESVLERIFPMNDMIRLIVVLSILLYFALLKNYLQNLQSSLVN